MKPPADPFDLGATLVHATPTGSIESRPARGRAHPSVEGWLAGEARMTKSPPHQGEMHPDGDELLYLIEGSVDVALDEEAGERVVALAAGSAFVVPRGICHRVIVNEPCRLLHFTPGRSQVRRRRP